jgi:hypothetical protein
MSNIGIEKRDIDLIDWRKVSTNLVTGLEKEQQRRDTLKKEIDDNTRSLEDSIARTPVGNNDKANGWIMNYSSNATENLLAMHRGLKNGVVNPKDYSTFMANAKSSTSRIFDAAKVFNEESKVVSERAQKGIASAQEIQAMALVESFFDLEKSATIFQSDGNVQIVKMQNGKQVDGADGRITSNQLMGIIGSRIEKYDLNASTAAAVSQVGDFISETLSSPGGKDALAIMTKTKDPSQLQAIGPDGERIGKQWLKTEQLLADQMLASPWNTASVLFDHSGGQYQMTLDPEKAASDKSYVLYSYVGGRLQPNFETENGKKQKSIAEGVVKDKIRSQIGQEVTKQAVRPQVEEKPRPEPTYEWQLDRADKKKEQENALQLWMRLFTEKTPEGKQTAKSGLLGSPAAQKLFGGNIRLLDIDVSDGKVAKLKFDDATQDREIPLNTTADKWAIAGTLLHGQQNAAELERRYKNASVPLLTPDQWKNVKGGAAGDYINAPIISTDILKLSSGKAAPALNEILKQYGFKVVDNSSWFNNKISIQKIDDKGKVVGSPFTFESKDGQESNTLMNITKWLESQLNPNAIIRPDNI